MADPQHSQNIQCEMAARGNPPRTFARAATLTALFLGLLLLRFCRPPSLGWRLVSHSPDNGEAGDRRFRGCGKADAACVRELVLARAQV